jgi:glycosyltransferase involved in cell wall biosynthesis
LESALAQSLPRHVYEIIVVDDGSSDRTGEIVEGYPVKLIRQKNQGPAVARNRGAAEAKGAVIVFTDSDCELDPEFLQSIISPIEKNPQIAGVQGSYKTKQKEFMARFGQVEIETRYRRMAMEKYIDFIGTYAAAYKRDVFVQFGGFDTGFPMASGEDTEFSYKLCEKGYKLVFRPEAFVYHQHPARLDRYLRTKFYRGYWRVRLYSLHPEKTLRDSYTPQSLKIQVMVSPLVPVFLFFGLLHLAWLVGLFVVLAAFLGWSWPFVRAFGRKGYEGTWRIPPVIFLRAICLFGGLSWGMLNKVYARGGTYQGKPSH